MAKPSKPSVAPKTDAEIKVEPMKAPAYPSVSALALGDHIPDRVDLRPYSPEFESGGLEHATAAAIAAVFARTGRPLPFVPSPEHIAAVGDVAGLNKYGVRANGVKIGNPPTEYDLTADAVKLKVEVYSASTVNEICAAFAAGYAVRVGDAFLVAYQTTENGYALALTNGSAMSGQLAFDSEVEVWSVTRV